MMCGAFVLWKHTLKTVEAYTFLLFVSCAMCTLQQCKIERNLSVSKVGEKHSGRISENREREA